MLWASIVQHQPLSLILLGCKMKRESFTLTPEEVFEFRRLRPLPDEAFEFWRLVAHKRGLDYKTIIGTDTDFTGHVTFTAMSLGHGKQWCWPAPLKCMSPPRTN